MGSSPSETTGDSFDLEIKQWSLAFADPSLELAYQHQRITFQHIPKQMKFFFIIGAAVNALLAILDMITAFLTDPDYQYQTSDIVFMIMYVPMFICEYMFYRFKTLSIMRGAFITCFIYFTIFYGTSVRYYNPCLLYTSDAADE
eukprot:TRINITY_DN3782_c0_g4_i2.p1 TRINITY_DN3782_c0_g4~~TRINITY_DN3782_c0_g4_i2.p1  ORF type:complete len:144 (+),score=24.41 TRINITY_DN3782_c0_g4_i2:49-480(+)